jgi:hypothetical protein
MSQKNKKLLRKYAKSVAKAVAQHYQPDNPDGLAKTIEPKVQRDTFTMWKTTPRKKRKALRNMVKSKTT